MRVRLKVGMSKRCNCCVLNAIVVRVVDRLRVTM